LAGPESFMCDNENKLMYTGLADGTIIRFKCDAIPIPNQFERVIRTGIILFVYCLFIVSLLFVDCLCLFVVYSCVFFNLTNTNQQIQNKQK